MRFNNIDRQYKALKPQLDAAYHRVMDSGWVILGDEVKKFEEEYAAYCGAKYCVGVGSGLDALIISLKCLGVGKGDEVIVPANTYIATWLAVEAVGAQIVPVEPDMSYCLDPRLAEEKITSKTKAIIPVHLFGVPADRMAFTDIARRHGVAILYDAAQAHGARSFDQPIGGVEDVSAWSFYPSKNLGALGDAGAITTDNAEIAQKAMLLRNYGSPQKYFHEIKGINSRLDELQAAFLRVKLRYLDKMNDRRRSIAHKYDMLITNLALKPMIPAWSKSVYHQYVIRVEDRGPFGEWMSDRGIPTLIHYPIPPHLTGAFKNDGFGEYPITEKLANTMVSLPIDPFLTDDEVEYVIRTVNEWWPQVAHSRGG